MYNLYHNIGDNGILLFKRSIADAFLICIHGWQVLIFSDGAWCKIIGKFLIFIKKSNGYSSYLFLPLTLGSFFSRFSLENRLVLSIFLNGANVFRVAHVHLCTTSPPLFTYDYINHRWQTKNNPLPILRSPEICVRILSVAWMAFLERRFPITWSLRYSSKLKEKIHISKECWLESNGMLIFACADFQSPSGTTFFQRRGCWNFMGIFFPPWNGNILPDEKYKFQNLKFRTALGWRSCHKVTCKKNVRFCLHSLLGGAIL